MEIIVTYTAEGKHIVHPSGVHDFKTREDLNEEIGQLSVEMQSTMSRINGIVEDIKAIDALRG